MKTAAETVGELQTGEFAISIDDGYCEWTYKMYLSRNTSIAEIMDKIGLALKTDRPSGTLRRGSVL